MYDQRIFLDFHWHLYFFFFFTCLYNLVLAFKEPIKSKARVYALLEKVWAGTILFAYAIPILVFNELTGSKLLITVQSLYNISHYNSDLGITWSCCGYRFLYH